MIIQVNHILNNCIIYRSFATRFIHLHKLIPWLEINLISCAMPRLNVSAMIYRGRKSVGDTIDVAFIIDTMFTE